MKNYHRGDEICVTIDREGLGQDEGIGHLPDETMVVVLGAGHKVGETVSAIITADAATSLGNSFIANAK